MKQHFPVIILIITAFLGQAVSFGPVYAYHLAIMGILGYIIAKRETGNYLKHIWKNGKIWLALLSYVFLSILWAPNLKTAIQYDAYLFCGTFLVFTLPFFIRTLEDRTRAEKLIIILFLAHLGLSLLEILTPLRWPISAYSSLNGYFKKPLLDFNPFFDHYPTSFFWHQNNCALVTLMFLPFIVRNNSKFRLPVIALSYLVIFFCGSKSIFLVAALYGVILIIRSFKATLFKPKKVVVASLAVIILIAIGYAFSHEEQKKELRQTLSTVVGYAVPMTSYISSKINNTPFDFKQLNENIRERYHYMEGILGIYLDSPILGAGAGAHSGRKVKIQGSHVDLTSPHNYWLELFIQFGFLFSFLYGLWFIKILKGTFNTPYFECLILFFLGAPVLSSAVYFLPKWILYGLSQARGGAHRQKPEALA